MQKNTNKKTNKKSIKLIVRPSQFHSITKMLFKVRPSIFSKTFNVNENIWNVKNIKNIKTCTFAKIIPSNNSWLSSPFKKYILCLDGEITVYGKKDNTHSKVILTPTKICTEYNKQIKYNNSGKYMLVIDNILLHKIENITSTATIMCLFENNYNFKKTKCIEESINDKYTEADYEEEIINRIIRNGGL